MNIRNTSRIAASYRPKKYALLRSGGSLGDADLPLPKQKDALRGKRTGLKKLLKRGGKLKPTNPSA